LIKTLLARFFSFDGRIARLPYFVRTQCLGIALLVILAAIHPPSLGGGDLLLWWVVSFVLFAYGNVLSPHDNLLWSIGLLCIASLTTGGVAALVIHSAIGALSSSDDGPLWWIGFPYAIACIAILIIGTVSLIVRRLHDLGLSGYHVIWVGAPLVAMSAPPYGPLQALLFLAVLVINLWLVFWPSNTQANRFREAPN
jgi:uncharacterized membrane protein YhaH (DUF805 family)